MINFHTIEKFSLFFYFYFYYVNIDSTNLNISKEYYK